MNHKSLFYLNGQKPKASYLIKIGQVFESSLLLELYPPKEKTVENTLMSQFERECILQLDPSRHYVFEVFVPVLKNKQSPIRKSR